MKKIAFLLFLLITSIFWVAEVNAATISPLRQAISLEPGTKKSLSVEITNNADQRKKFQAEVKPFEIDAKGNIKYSGTDKAENWLIYNKNPFILQPNESRDVSFTINAPNNAKPKSHYLVLFIREVGTQQNISAAPGVGSLLFLHVAGVREEKLETSNFFSDKGFYFNEPIKLSLSLNNKGSIHLIPQGQVSLLDEGKMIDKARINSEKDLILPDGNLDKTFTFEELSWKDTGKITAVAYLNYGRTDKPLSERVEFWYISPQIYTTAIILLSAALLFMLALKFYPRFKEND